VEVEAWNDGMMEYWSDGYGPNIAAVGCRRGQPAGCKRGQPPVVREGNRRLPLLYCFDRNHVGRAGLMQRQTCGDRDEIPRLYHA
jgi:hypothetical protein